MGRILALAILTATALAQRSQLSHTTESLRGVSAVTQKIAWASGTHGTYLRTIDAVQHWHPAQVLGAEALDFRAVVAFSADEAFLMSSGTGDQSRIYRTTDAGQHWQLQFKNANPKGFFDSMIFFDHTHGIALGDPVADETGKLKFELITTEDGQTWNPIPPSQLPPAIEGEGAFAASNTCLAIVPVSGDETMWKSGASAPRQSNLRQVSLRMTNFGEPSFGIASFAMSSFGVAQRFNAAIESSEKDGASAPEATFQQNTQHDPFKKPATKSAPHLQKRTTPDHNLWFATGGSVARVFHSTDRGQTWDVADTPIVHGPDSAGIFSIAFRDPLHGVIAGGDYKHPDQDGPNLAFTEDGGKTWKLSSTHPQAFFSAAAYDRKDSNKERLYEVAQDFVLDARPSSVPKRIHVPEKSGMKLNAISPYPDGGALAVGAKGAILSIP